MEKTCWREREVLEVLSFLFEDENLSVLERWKLLSLTFNLLNRSISVRESKLILIKSKAA